VFENGSVVGNLGDGSWWKWASFPAGYCKQKVIKNVRDGSVGMPACLKTTVKFLLYAN
jgi:hypothetical protein